MENHSKSCRYHASRRYRHCASRILQVTESGAPGAPIKFLADNNVVTQGFTIHANYITVSGFEITNTPNDNQDGWGIFLEGNNCVVKDNYIHFATRGGINIWARPGSETNTNHCTVQNNRLYRNSQSGIEVSGRDNLVEGNEVWGTIQYHPNWPNPPSWVDADGIKFFGSGHVIRGNFVHDISYNDPENISPHIDCFQTFGNSDHEFAQNIILEDNICKNVQAKTSMEFGKGFMLENAKNLLIRNNIIEAFSNVVLNKDSDVTIVNNIFTSSLTLNMSFDTSGVSLSNATYTVVKNNIFYNLPNHIIYLHDTTSKQGMDVGYNCVFRSDGQRLWDSPYPHDLWGVNPQFVNPGADNFQLLITSPAIDAGVGLGSLNPSDMNGNPRPQGAGYDIGAYERTPSNSFFIWLPSIIAK